MPAIYSDNMIIQRGKPFIVKGTANAGDEVTIKLGKQKAKAFTNDWGEWQATFQPMEADGKSYTMTVECCKEKITYKNIVVGEV